MLLGDMGIKNEERDGRESLSVTLDFFTGLKKANDNTWPHLIYSFDVQSHVSKPK